MCDYSFLLEGMMNKKIKVLMTAIIGLSLMGTLVSCKQEGAAEKVGQKIDESVQKSKDVAHDIKDDITKKR
jgi:hypothetical protein